jgi:hypothetical protein
MEGEEAVMTAPDEPLQYKKGRLETPSAFHPDLENLSRVLHALHIPSISHPFLEADDLMAGLSRDAVHEGWKVACSNTCKGQVQQNQWLRKWN